MRLATVSTTVRRASLAGNGEVPHALATHRHCLRMARGSRRGPWHAAPRRLAPTPATLFHGRRRLEARGPLVRACAGHIPSFAVKSQEASMNPHLITAYLLMEAHEHPQGQVAEALQGVLTDEMRTYAATRSALIDWAIAGDDIASSIVQTTLLDDYARDGTAFSLWPGTAFCCR